MEGSHLLASLLKAAEDGEPVSLPIYDFRGLTYVWDVVHSIERIMLLPPGIYNLGSENKRSTYETAILFASVMAGRQPISRLVSPDSRRFAQMPRNLTVNTEKIKSFGIALGDTMQGFGRCCRDYGVPYPFSGKSSVIV